MSDAKNPPECSEVLKLLEHGPLCAHEISHLLRCSIKQTLERVHNCWFSIVPVTGDWKGWKYQRRQVLSARGKVVKEVGEFNDGGLSHGGKRAVFTKEMSK